MPGLAPGFFVWLNAAAGRRLRELLIKRAIQRMSLPRPFSHWPAKAQLEVAFERRAQRDVAASGLLAQLGRAVVQHVQRPLDLAPLFVQPGLVHDLRRPRAALVDMSERAVADAVGQRLEALGVGPLRRIARNSLLPDSG